MTPRVLRRDNATERLSPANNSLGVGLQKDIGDGYDTLRHWTSATYKTRIGDCHLLVATCQDILLDAWAYDGLRPL